ncbi:MAG: hypothetical protein ABW168_16955 [Sedimenticola sp.]
MFQPADCSDIPSPAVSYQNETNQCPYPSTPHTLFGFDESAPYGHTFRNQMPIDHHQVWETPQTDYVAPTSSHATKVSIPKFCGYTHEDPARFIDTFRSYCLLSGIDRDEPRKIAAFHLHMAGPALSWFNSLLNQSKANWTALHHAFTSYYIPNDNSVDAGMLAESAAFDALYLQPRQHIEDFYSAVVDKGMKLKKPDRDIISKFVNGLPHQMAFFVRAGKAQTLRDALQAAKIAEAYGYRSHVSEMSHNINMVKPVANAMSTNLERNITDQLSQISKRLDNLEMGRGRPVSRQPRPPTSRSERECFSCGGAGHFERQCNWSGEGAKRPDLQCQICNQKGHGAQRCKLVASDFRPSHMSQENRPGLEAYQHGTSKAIN